jgi:hypothetical protein
MGRVSPRFQTRASALFRKEFDSLREGMVYKNLGNSEVVVSQACVGALMWGDQVSSHSAHQMLDIAFDEFGVNFIVRGVQNQTIFFRGSHKIICCARTRLNFTQRHHVQTLLVQQIESLGIGCKSANERT